MPRIAAEQLNRLEMLERAQRFPEDMSRRDRAVYLASHALGWAHLQLLRLVKEPAWRRGDGRIVLMRDMSLQHLQNARRVTDDPLNRWQLEQELDKRFNSVLKGVTSP